MRDRDAPMQIAVSKELSLKDLSISFVTSPRILIIRVTSSETVRLSFTPLGKNLVIDLTAELYAFCCPQ